MRAPTTCRDKADAAALAGSNPYDVRRGERGEALRLAFVEFLTGAIACAASVIAIGVVVYVVDRVRPGPLEPLHRTLSGNLFASSDATAQFLQMVASTVITVASITFSLLLVAIQQSASSLTAQVFDQFLRRRANQFYIGFFIGLGVYALLQAAAVHDGFTPVYGATFAVGLSAVAVALLLVLVYTAINEMRPVVIVESIHDHLMEARATLLRSIVARTRREPQLASLACTPVYSDKTGFVLRVNLDAIQAAISAAGCECEVVLDVSIGDFVAYGDRLARVLCDDGAAPASLATAVERAVRRERQRTIDGVDAAYGIEQLETVGWTSISGAKHNPHAARLVVAQLRDIIARVIAERHQPSREPDTAIVYYDNVPDVLMNTLESLAVITADSQQHQIAADIVNAFAGLLDVLPDDYRERANSLLMRTLPALASHPPTLVLERALESLRQALLRTGAGDAAATVDQGLANLRERIGRVDVQYSPR